MSIVFNVSKKDAAIISAIAVRAVKSAKEAGWRYDQRDAEMDITACHRNGTPICLADLLAADDFNFSHDVLGIRRNLDRRTGKLLNHFHPRHSKPERRTS